MTAKINQLMFTALIIHISGAVASAVRSVCIRITGEWIAARESRKLHIWCNKIRWIGITIIRIRYYDRKTYYRQFVGRCRIEFRETICINRIDVYYISETCWSNDWEYVYCLYIMCTTIRTDRKSARYPNSIKKHQVKHKIIPPKEYQQCVLSKAFVAKERERQRYKIKIGIPSFYPYNHRQDEEGEEKSNTTTTTITTTFRIGYDQSLVGSVFTFCIFGGGFGAWHGTL